MQLWQYVRDSHYPVGFSPNTRVMLPIHGKSVDMAVLDQNIFTEPAIRLEKTCLMKTVFLGNVLSKGPPKTIDSCGRALASLDTERSES